MRDPPLTSGVAMLALRSTKTAHSVLLSVGGATHRPGFKRGSASNVIPPVRRAQMPKRTQRLQTALDRQASVPVNRATAPRIRTTFSMGRSGFMWRWGGFSRRRAIRRAGRCRPGRAATAKGECLCAGTRRFRLPRGSRPRCPPSPGCQSCEDRIPPPGNSLWRSRRMIHE